MARKSSVILLLILAIYGSVLAEGNLRLEANLAVKDGLYSLRTATPRFLNSEILKVLQAGVRITLIYEVQVWKRNPVSLYIFPSKTYVFRKTIDCDVMNRLFVLNRFGEIQRSADLADTIESFYNSETLILKGLVMRGPASGYICRYRIRMDDLKLYPPLSLVVNMVDTYRYSTDWFEINMDVANEKKE